VHDAGDPVLGKRADHGTVVSHRTDLKRDAVGHPALVAGGQVVEYNDTRTVRQQRAHHVRPDESSTSGYQPRHVSTLSETPQPFGDDHVIRL
jgi:hypothetical protein